MTCTGDKLGIKTPIGEVPDIALLDLVTGADTAAAQNAFVEVNEDERVRVWINGVGVALAVVVGPGYVVVVNQVLQFAVTIDLTRHTVVGMVGEQRLQNEFAGFAGFFALGVNHHPLKNRRGAGCL